MTENEILYRVTPTPSTMREMIHRSGPVTRFRWWLFLRLSAALYFVCPQPHRSYFKSIWSAKMGEFKEAADRIERAQR